MNPLSEQQREGKYECGHLKLEFKSYNVAEVKMLAFSPKELH